MLTLSNLDQLKKHAVDLLRQYCKAPDETRTPIVRSLAELLVDARSQFQRADGSPDWKGRSYAYRNFVNDVYRQANIPADEAATIQAAVRYHVGAVLRERLDDKTLRDYGLIKQSPKERSTERREARTALLNALSHGQVGGGTVMSLTAALNVLSNVRPSETELTPEEQRLAVLVANEVEREVYRIRKTLLHAG